MTRKGKSVVNGSTSECLSVTLSISFFRYVSNNKYRLVKEFPVDEAQAITAMSAVNSFYSCILTASKYSNRTSIKICGVKIHNFCTNCIT